MNESVRADPPTPQQKGTMFECLKCWFRVTGLCKVVKNQEAERSKPLRLQTSESAAKQKRKKENEERKLREEKLMRNKTAELPYQNSEIFIHIYIH